MDTAWRRARDHLEPVVYKLEFCVFSDGFENSSDSGATDATATDHRTATATTAAAGPGPGRSPGRYGPATAPPASSPAGDAAVAVAVASSSSSSSAAAADGFPRFLDLPPELRLRVWEELIQPRIIMVACCPASPASHPRRLAKLAQLRARQRRLSAAAPSAAVPVLLHACRESRALALRHYQPAFAWRAPLPTVPAPGDYDGERRAGAPARVYFNFRLDALYLMGELDREDEFGFVGSPLAYYLDRADAARVRHVVVALEELLPPRPPPTPPPLPLTLMDGNAAVVAGGFGGGGGGVVGGDERVFSSLFHVVDRFSAAERLLVACTARDVEEGKEQHGSSWSPPPLSPLPGEDNVVQKIWRGWLGGTSVVSSTLLDKKILMVREDELQGFIRAHL